MKCSKCNGTGKIKISSKKIKCYFCNGKKEIDWVENIFGVDGFQSRINNDLINSSKDGHLEVVKYLIKNGANVHAMNDKALICASNNGHLEIVKYLIKNGANVHADNDYALRYASNNGHLEIVKYLIKNGANVHAMNDLSLGWASKNGYLEIVKYLESIIKRRT